LHELAARESAILLTTAKDWVRLPPALRSGIEVLEVEIRWRDPDMVEQLLANSLSRCHDRSDLGIARG
jgi:tetraacyldisaccharide 4'-kinase